MGSALAIAVIITAIVIIAVSANKCNILPNYSFQRNVDWNDDTYRTLMSLWSTFGNPVIYDSKPNGRAVWSGRQLAKTYWTRIVVYDQGMKHDDHVDYIAVTVSLSVPASLVSDVLSMSSAIHYDTANGELTVMCNNIPCVVATIHAVAQFVNEQINTADAAVAIKQYKSTMVSAEVYDKMSYELANILDTR